MPMRYALVILLLVLLPALNGCGGSSEGPAATPTAPTSISIKVSPTTAITTDESGLTAAISVSLGSKPTDDVTIPVNSSDTTEGTVDKESLVFTKETWATVQTITVTGVDDPSSDGNQSYTIHLGPADSTDSFYRGLEKFVSATNLDVRKGAFVVSPISGNTSESGTTATFEVRLGSAPAADVTLPIQSSDLTEGTVDKASLTFTPDPSGTLGSWEDYQTVTVAGVDDGIADAYQEYTIQLGPAVSADHTYNNVDPDDLRLTNLALQPGFVDVINISGNSTDESGAQVTFQVKLHSQPTAEVTIPVSSSDDTEGLVSKSGMASPAHNLTLTFTPDPSGTAGSWNDPQTVTVTGVDDPEADGTVGYSIKLEVTSSADANYNGLDPVDVSLSNLNVKTGSFTITAPTSLITTEDGKTTATFQVRLDTAPFSDVTIPVTSLKTSEGVVYPPSLLFTSDDYGDRTVTVTGVSDKLYDGDITYSIQLGTTISVDDNYSSLAPQYLSVTNQDVREPSYVVTPTSITTHEAGGTADFYVSLGSQPSEDVTIAIISPAPLEGTVIPTSLTFTSADWATPQKVTVTGIGDDGFDDTTYLIELAAAVSADLEYNGSDPPDVTVRNEDRKTGSVTVSPGHVYTDDSGQQSATFTVTLNRAAKQDVTLDVTPACPSEMTVSTTSLNFTVGEVEKTVTVTGVKDDKNSGNQECSITLGETSSGDYNFAGYNPADVTVTIVGLVDPYGVVPMISAGDYHSLLLASDGTVWGWGMCKDGQLDASPTTCPPTTYFNLPQPLNISMASVVSAGDSFSTIVKSDGTVWTSGVNVYSQLGRSGGSSFLLGKVDLLTDVCKVSAGGSHVLALKDTPGDGKCEGEVWAWGMGGSGQLGDGSNAIRPTPVQAIGALLNKKNVTAIAAGDFHSLALDSSKLVYAWGSDGNGQLGLGSGDQSNLSPALITSLSEVTAIAVGDNYSFAVGKYNNAAAPIAYGWGQNNDQQLGGISTNPKQGPLKVESGSYPWPQNPSRLDGGALHSLALVGGNISAWGDNDSEGLRGGDDDTDSLGALGNGEIPNTTTNTIIDLPYPNDPFNPTPFVKPDAHPPAVDLSAGNGFSIVMLNDGRLLASGVGTKGQLGTNEVLGDIEYSVKMADGSIITAKIKDHTVLPIYVNDPGNSAGSGSPKYFYAYRPILSGQPATGQETTSTSATITVCANTLVAPANCGPITHYMYRTDINQSWVGPFEVGDITGTKITLSDLEPGTINLWVKGMTSLTNEIQTDASAVNVSWTVVAP